MEFHHPEPTGDPNLPPTDDFVLIESIHSRRIEDAENVPVLAPMKASTLGNLLVIGSR
jgi:hypothetical protein